MIREFVMRSSFKLMLHQKHITALRGNKPFSVQNRLCITHQEDINLLMQEEVNLSPSYMVVFDNVWLQHWGMPQWTVTSSLIWFLGAMHTLLIHWEIKKY